MIDCFSKHKIEGLEDKFNQAIKGKPESEHRAIATKIVLDYHKELFDEVNKLRTKKLTYTQPEDKSGKIKNIQDEYDKKIADIDAESKKQSEKLPPEPPKPPKEEKTEAKDGGVKKKGVLTHLYEAKNIPEAAREGFKKEGLKYETKSQEEAEQVAKSIIDELGLDDAIELAEAQKFDGDVNSLIYAESLNRLKEQEDAAKTPEEKIASAKRFAEVGIMYDEAARKGGRFNAAINYFYKKSPLGIVMMENMKRGEDFNNWAKPKDKSWQEFFDDLMNINEFKDVVKGKVDETLKKERQGGRAKRIEKVRSAFKAAKEKFRKEGGGTYSTIIPPHIMETVLETMELAYEAGEAVAKIISDAVDYISKELKTDVWDKDKFISEWEEKLRDTSTKKTLTDEEIKSKIIDKFRKKLKGLSDKQKEDVIRRAYKKLIDAGALEFDDFKEIIAQVTGRAELTADEINKMKELVAKTNAVGDAAKKVQEERSEESLKEFRDAEVEAGKATRELNDLFYNKPDIVKRLTSIMQLSTLGIPALVNNPIYNIWNQSTLRFPIAFVNDLIDRTMSAVANLTGKTYEKEYNILAAQKGFWNQLSLGAKESIEQVGTGLNRQDYIQKEVYGQQIRPFKAIRDIIAYSRGKKPLTRRQYFDKLIQGTVGIPAEAVARLLNIGDKPQRFAAEGGQASIFAKALGLKDIDYKIFMEFPREEAYRAYKAQGLSDEVASQKADYIKEAIIKEGQRSTFQQDNLLNDFLTRAFSIFGGKDSGTANLTKTLAVSPYIKIPSNAFWSLYNLLNPEIAILQSFVHGGRSKYLNNKGEQTKSQLANREARYWMAHAIVGMAMRAVVIALVKEGIFTPGSDEDDSRKERDAVSYFDKPGTTNIGGVKISNRWFGQWGMMGNAIAKKYRDATPEQRENQDEFWNIVLGGMEVEGLKELENGIFANSSSLLQSLNSGSWDRYGMNTINMFSNILQPATVAQINRASLNEVPTARGDSFLEKLNQNFAQRSALYRNVFDVQIKQKRDIWGQHIPKGGNVLSRMFGISKENPQLFSRPIYDDYLRTNDSGFLPPSVSQTLNGKKLTENQYDKLQEYVGNERKRLIEPYVNDMAEIEGIQSKYSNIKSEDKKKEYLNRIYDIGRKNGLNKFYKDYPELKPKK